MITKAKEYTYTSSTGKKYATLEGAQRSELAIILNGAPLAPEDTTTANTIDKIMASAAQIIDVLTTTPTSKNKARKINGGRKPRKPATPETSLEPEAPQA